MTAATDRHGLDVLSMAECLSLLRSRPLGRLAYLERGQPSVVPVNHLVDGASIVMRSLAGSKLDAAVLNKPVAFQLDDHDPTRGTGWSVLVRGTAQLVEGEREISLYAAELDSWAVTSPEEATWIRIDPDEISGRRLRREVATEQ